MVKFIVIRHGYSTGNKDKIFCGQMDVPLNETGFYQAEQTGKYVVKNYKVDAVYSSDLVRVTETVRPTADKLGLPINTDKRLREVDVGDWQGIPFADVEREHLEDITLYRQYPARFTFPNGECYTDMLARVVDFFNETASKNDGKTIVVGTHGGCIRTLLAYINGLSLDEIGEIPFVPNASVTVINYDNGKYEIELMSYSDHLDVNSGKFLVV